MRVNKLFETKQTGYLGTFCVQLYYTCVGKHTVRNVTNCKCMSRYFDRLFTIVSYLCD